MPTVGIGLTSLACIMREPAVIRSIAFTRDLSTGDPWFCWSQRMQAALCWKSTDRRSAPRWLISTRREPVRWGHLSSGLTTPYPPRLVTCV